MKFVRFGQKGQEKPGLIDPNGGIRDLSAYVTDINPSSLCDPFALQQFEKFDWTALPLVDKDTRLGACVGSIGKIIGIGFNSKQHAVELGLNQARTEPLLFLKPTCAVSGPNDPILYTRHTKKIRLGSRISYCDRQAGQVY